MLSVKQGSIKYHSCVFGTIRPKIEPRSPRPLANTLLNSRVFTNGLGDNAYSIDVRIEQLDTGGQLIRFFVPIIYLVSLIWVFLLCLPDSFLFIGTDFVLLLLTPLSPPQCIHFQPLISFYNIYIRIFIHCVYRPFKVFCFQAFFIFHFFFIIVTIYLCANYLYDE